MTVIDTARITSKGQITIPNRIRKILHLSQGSSVAFSVGRNGVMLTPCAITVESPYTPQEWEKIKKLTAVKGKTFKTAQAAVSYVNNL